MAENKKGFVLYADLIYTVKKLTDDKAGLLLKHILSYVNDENPITNDIVVEIAFEPIKQQLKRDLKKYESIKEKRSLAGQKSAEIKQQNSTKATHVESVEQNQLKTTGIKNIEQRKSEFTLSLNPFLEKYTNEFGLNGAKEMLNKFYVYWSESNPNGKKMKWEMQKTFDLAARIRTWADNQIKFNKTNSNGTKQGSPGSRKADIVALNKLSSDVLQQFELNEDIGGNTK